jgi:hypothetical protein
MGNLAPYEADILQKFVLVYSVGLMNTDYKFKANITVDVTTLPMRL